MAAARLLLIHSPLVGPELWDQVAGQLTERGYEVNVPDLTATVAAQPPYCRRQAEVIARSASGRPPVLIGHSGAGPLLAAAGASTGQARGYIFADAGLPIPGQTWMETVPPELASQVREMADAQGLLPPWPQWWSDEVMTELIADPDQRRRFAAGCPALPLAMFEETHPAVPHWPDAPAGYLQLSDAYHGQAEKARDLGWPVITRKSHHLAPLTEPAMVTEALHELIGHLSK
jgi:alpha/beta hydrolase family protein